MKVHATLDNMRIAPRKVRLVTHAIVGVDANEALIQLSKQVKRSAQPLYDLLKSAMYNASNNFGLDQENLYVFEVRVGDGMRLQRWLPRAFGRATPLIRRSSRVTIVLEEKIEGKNRTEKKQPTEVVTVEESEELVGTKEKKQSKGSKPVTKQDTGKDIAKKTPGKVMKKVFQRKSV
jgi:large subunit ribosomal protein L22